MFKVGESFYALLFSDGMPDYDDATKQLIEGMLCFVDETSFYILWNKIV